MNVVNNKNRWSLCYLRARVCCDIWYIWYCQLWIVLLNISYLMVKLFYSNTIFDNLLQTWKQRDYQSFGITVCRCAPAVMWVTASGWITCLLIYSNAVNLFPPRDTDRHNKTPPTQSHEPLPSTRGWIFVWSLFIPTVFLLPASAVFPPEGHFLVTDCMQANWG